MSTERVLANLWQNGDGSGPEEIRSLGATVATDALAEAAAGLRDLGHGRTISFSKKVFIPLTHLCRDVCHYCTFAKPPRPGEASFLTSAEVGQIAEAGRQAGCKEALFTLGDKPELRYRAARSQLADLGYASTLDYLQAVAGKVFEEYGLLPHLNPGVMTADELSGLRKVSVSQGIMLETASDRLGEKGGPHYGSPDKVPSVRLGTLKAAGELAIPFTTGILIGIGETRQERLDALLVLADLHRAHGHLQEIIIQNFRAKPDTKMARAPEPPLEELVWTIAMARLIFGPDMNIQAPPNLSGDQLGALIDAGINDWGGVSPVTPDFVNPEAPWPQLARLAEETANTGKVLVERLAIYPSYVREMERWIDPSLQTAVRHAVDADGLARADGWMTGQIMALPQMRTPTVPLSDKVQRVLDRASSGERLTETETANLFRVRGSDVDHVIAAADRLRAEAVGGDVTYVVNRNINYTNVCYFRCAFCAFSKGRLSANLRGRPYDLSADEIERRVVEAWARGATEVCMQGGIHPDYTGQTYLDLCRLVKSAAPDIHIHAFSPLEVTQGAETLGMSVDAFLAALKEAGLGSLPGTAAEILDDEVRAIICPDKITTDQWLDVVRTAHDVGLKTTATIMYGHVEGAEHWARHLLRVRDLQALTGGITEFVPLPFVPMEAPMFLRGQARPGPTFREAVLMHAVARIVLHPLVPNIQTSWVKMGPEGVKACLAAGVNDLGGTLMNETITRAAGAAHGQEMAPERMDDLIRSVGRNPRQRTTLYRPSSDQRQAAAYAAAALADVVNSPAQKFERPRRQAMPEGVGSWE